MIMIALTCVCVCVRVCHLQLRKTTVYSNTGITKKSTALLLAADVSGVVDCALEGRVTQQIVQKERLSSDKLSVADLEGVPWVP